MLVEAKLLVLHLMTGLVFFECWYSLSEEGCSPCIVDLGKLETRFGKCDNQMCWAAKGLDPEILEHTGQGPTLDRYFIMLIFYVALSCQ